MQPERSIGDGIRRLPAALVHNTLEAFNSGGLPAADACKRLAIGRSRLYELRHSWLRAGRSLEHSGSGGDRRKGYPQEIAGFIRAWLATCRPPNFAQLAEEPGRRFGFKRSRSTLIDWCRTHAGELLGRAMPKSGARPRRRWQRSRCGELLPHDTPPHVWWPNGPQTPLALTIDDATRYICQATFIGRQTTWAHFLHTRRLIEQLGLPEAIYTDALSVFGNHAPAADGSDLCSRFQRALLSLGVGRLVARDAQAKGKIERRFHFWQNHHTRPFAMEAVASHHCVSERLAGQIDWHNANHPCRTTGLTPIQAMEKTRETGSWAWRSAPPGSLLDLAFSIQLRRRINADNTIDFNGRTWPISPTRQKSAVIIHHPEKRFRVVENHPDPKNFKWPIILASYHLGATPGIVRF